MKKLVIVGLLTVLFLGYNLHLEKTTNLNAGILSMEEMRQISAEQACSLCARACKDTTKLDCIMRSELAACQIPQTRLSCSGTCIACDGGVGAVDRECEGERNKCSCSDWEVSCAAAIPGSCVNESLDGTIYCTCMEMTDTTPPTYPGQSCGNVWACSDSGTCIACE